MTTPALRALPLFTLLRVKETRLNAVLILRTALRAENGRCPETAVRLKLSLRSFMRILAAESELLRYAIKLRKAANLHDPAHGRSFGPGGAGRQA